MLQNMMLQKTKYNNPTKYAIKVATTRKLNIVSILGSLKHSSPTSINKAKCNATKCNDEC